MLLLMIACADYPSEAPALPSQPNRMDTAVDNGPSVFVGGGDGGGKPPLIVKARIGKATATRAAALTLEVRDPEGARTSTKVDWYVNDVRVTGETGNTLAPKFYKKGDTISARVEVSDGVNKRETEVAGVTVENSPPVFMTRRSDFRKIDGFELKVRDPDDDTLTFRLEDAPPGMTISQAGRLSYSGSTDGTGGRWSTKIVVEDPDGEAIIWPVDVDISAGSGG